MTTTIILVHNCRVMVLILNILIKNVNKLKHL